MPAAARRTRAKPAPPRVTVRQAPNLRGRLWVEAGGGVALTDAGVDLLEQIEASGSLSEAARRLRFNYRRAWMLVDAMNRRWPAALVVLSTGGRKGGGARLTESGRLAIRAYRDLQIEFEHFLDRASGPFGRSVK